MTIEESPKNRLTVTMMNSSSTTTAVTESTPLVTGTGGSSPSNNKSKQHQHPPFSVLVEIIGARSLPTCSSTGSTNHFLEPYCVIQYGARTIHRTKPIVPHVTGTDRIGRLLSFFSSSSPTSPTTTATATAGTSTATQQQQPLPNSTAGRIQRQLENPVWTVQENSVFCLDVSARDIDNKRPLVVTVYGRPRQRRRRTGGNMENNNTNGTTSPLSASSGGAAAFFEDRSENYKFIGKIRLPASQIMDYCCSEDRFELPLVDDFGRNVYCTFGSAGHAFESMIALRCRMASPSDVVFAQNWPRIAALTGIGNNPTSVSTSMKSTRDLFWKQADVLGNIDRTQASLATELPNSLIEGSSLTAALAASIGPAPNGKIIVKPYADPLVLEKHKKDKEANITKTLLQCMTPEELSNQVSLASRNWIHCGSKTSKSYGRLYIEVLSASDLPNVDLGSAVGNQTDAFVSIVYGDAICQTDIIDDELSPRWPCWSKRAFVFNINHPSHVVFVSVFGYKRHTSHRAIGRVEINTTNMQNSTLYDLKYPLLASSHSSSRIVLGTIRLRVRLEIDNERSYLLAALKPSPPMYVNCERKKSLRVARFTARGEYDNEDAFSIAVFQGYIDEILDGYLRRLVYATQDGFKSVALWRNQILLFGWCGFPIYSLVTFIMAVLMVEKPSLIPGMLLLLIGLFMLSQMQQRLEQPTPFRRCFGISHFVRILIFGRSSPVFDKVDINEGEEEIKVAEKQLKDRIANDNAFLGKKDALEKQLEELEDFSVESKSAILPLEFLNGLGKVQEIVGDIIRVIRFIDTVISWEESYLSFFLTLALIAIGFFFLLVPWGPLLKWTGRLAVIVILGPQNRIVDLVYVRHIPHGEEKIRQIFKERMIEARISQEEKQKMKSFRHSVFGKYSTAIPSQYWTRHRDFPLPSSFALHKPADFLPRGEAIDLLPSIRGQFLCGKMIPRPFDAWQHNHAQSRQKAADYKASLKQSYQGSSDSDENGTNFLSSPTPSTSAPSEEGFEPTELYDEERGYVQTVLRDDSMPELGVEVFENSKRDLNFESVYKSVHDFDDDDEDEDDNNIDGVQEAEDDENSIDSEDDDALNESSHDRAISPEVVEGGVEIVEVFDAESIFVQQSWASSGSSSSSRSGGFSAVDSLTEQKAIEHRIEQLERMSLDRNEEWQETQTIPSSNVAAARQDTGGVPPPPTTNEMTSHNDETIVQVVSSAYSSSTQDLGFEVIE